MNLIRGEAARGERDRALSIAKVILDGKTYENYETSVQKFFDAALPATQIFVDTLRKVDEEVSEVMGQVSSQVSYTVYHSSATARSLTPHYHSLRKSPDHYGWMRFPNVSESRLYYLYAHERWHITFELAYDSWRDSIQNMRLFPLWLLKQSALLNYPFQEMVCDMGAESVCERLGEPAPTRLLSHLRDRNPLAYQDFYELMNTVLNDFLKENPSAFAAPPVVSQGFDDLQMVAPPAPYPDPMTIDALLANLRI